MPLVPSNPSMHVSGFASAALNHVLTSELTFPVLLCLPITRTKKILRFCFLVDKKILMFYNTQFFKIDTSYNSLKMTNT
jgi:hypothetical protein